MKSVSILVAIAVVTAIVVALSITIALWVSGITSSYVEHYNVRVEVIEGVYAVKTFFIDLRNTGSRDTSVVDVFINKKQANLVWAWDLTENKYLGYNRPLLKAGHLVRLAIRSREVFTPGSLVEVKIHTSHGIEVYKLINIKGHVAMNYINNGGMHIWNYNIEHMLAIYRDYYELRDKGLIHDIPKLEVTIDSRSIREYVIEFNTWYAFLNLWEENTIITEIALTDGSGSWEFIDIEASSNGKLAFYTSYDDNWVDIDKRYLDPHTYKIVLKTYITGIVEVMLYIDDELLVDRNTSSIYGWFIANLCIGVWDEEAMYDMYLDKFIERIDWIYHSDTRVEEEFTTSSTNIFTSYTTEPNPSAIKSITSYPVKLYNETIGFEIETSI